MSYPPSRGNSPNGRPNPEIVEEAIEAFARSRFRSTILDPWGLSYEDAVPYRIGLHNHALLISYYAPSGTLEGCKLRLLGKSHQDEGRFKWLTKGRAPALYYGPGCLDGQIVIVAEGELKRVAFEKILLDRPVAAAPGFVLLAPPTPWSGKVLFWKSPQFNLGSGSPRLARGGTVESLPFSSSSFCILSIPTVL